MLPKQIDPVMEPCPRKEVQKVKVVTVGDMAVGKTCISFRFVNNKFEDKYKPTVGASFVAKAVDIPDKTVMFQVWDTAGQERFHSLIPMYLRDAEVALAVYDVTDRESFKSIKGTWLKKLHKHSPETICVAVVGNKMDLAEQKVVSTEEARKFAQDHNFLFMETSAKTGENIEKLFLDVAHLLEKNTDHSSPSKTTKDGNVELSKEENKRRCCKQS